MTFKIGDLVVLQSGGPSMTVEAIENKSVKCVWHDGKSIRERVVPEACLAEGEGTIEWALERPDRAKRLPFAGI